MVAVLSAEAGLIATLKSMGAATVLGGNIQDVTRSMTTTIALETRTGEFELGQALGILMLCITIAGQSDIANYGKK